MDLEILKILYKFGDISALTSLSKEKEEVKPFTKIPNFFDICFIFGWSYLSVR
jgi:hypothetical protein